MTHASHLGKGMDRTGSDISHRYSASTSSAMQKSAHMPDSTSRTRRRTSQQSSDSDVSARRTGAGHHSTRDSGNSHAAMSPVPRSSMHSHSGAGERAEEPLPAEVHGRYEKMRVLGRGAFGAVTLVKDIRDSRLYAIKTLPWGDKEDLRTAALAEVSLMRQLRHPFLVTLVDAFISVDGRLVCLAMTYCESGDLAKVIEHARKRSAPLAEKQVISWFCQACLGIAHLHARHQLLHRDIKPANLLLTESSRLLRIGDFGLAKTLGSHGQTVKTEVGTPYYTSPEMCSGAAYGYPSDVWSLGVVLHEMLALDVPFRGRDTVELVSRVACAAPPALPARYGAEVARLVQWLLQKDPARRPQLGQALCVPLTRKPALAVVAAYKPIAMPERQRRAEGRELSEQLAALTAAHGAVTIPNDVHAGCGAQNAAEPLLPSPAAAAAAAPGRDNDSSRRSKDNSSSGVRPTLAVSVRGGGTKRMMSWAPDDASATSDGGGGGGGGSGGGSLASSRGSVSGGMRSSFSSAGSGTSHSSTSAAAYSAADAASPARISAEPGAGASRVPSVGDRSSGDGGGSGGGSGSGDGDNSGDGNAGGSHSGHDAVGHEVTAPEQGEAAPLLLTARGAHAHVVQRLHTLHSAAATDGGGSGHAEGDSLHCDSYHEDATAFHEPGPLFLQSPLASGGVQRVPSPPSQPAPEGSGGGTSPQFSARLQGSFKLTPQARAVTPPSCASSSAPLLPLLPGSESPSPAAAATPAAAAPTEQLSSPVATAVQMGMLTDAPVPPLSPTSIASSRMSAAPSAASDGVAAAARSDAAAAAGAAAAAAGGSGAGAGALANGRRFSRQPPWLQQQLSASKLLQPQRPLQQAQLSPRASVAAAAALLAAEAPVASLSHAGRSRTRSLSVSARRRQQRQSSSADVTGGAERAAAVLPHVPQEARMSSHAQASPTKRASSVRALGTGDSAEVSQPHNSLQSSVSPRLSRAAEAGLSTAAAAAAAAAAASTADRKAAQRLSQALTFSHESGTTPLLLSTYAGSGVGGGTAAETRRHRASTTMPG